MPAYKEPIGDAPERVLRALRGETVQLYEVPGFAEFTAAGTTLGQNEAIEAFYAFVLSEGFACLKGPFLISMIRAASGTSGELAARLSEIIVPAIVCLVDVWTRSIDGHNPVEGYMPPAVLPLEQIAGEYAVSFRDFAAGSVFDEAIADNERYYAEHTLEGRALDQIHMGGSTYDSWLAHMCGMEPFITMAETELRTAYADLVARVGSPISAEYRDMIRESLQRRVSLRKCTAKLRQLAEIVDRIALGSAAAAQPGRGRPVTTPARVQSGPPTRIYRAAWNKPISA